jgi:hypothetical protein
MHVFPLDLNVSFSYTTLFHHHFLFSSFNPTSVGENNPALQAKNKKQPRHTRVAVATNESIIVDHLSIHDSAANAVTLVTNFYVISAACDDYLSDHAPTTFELLIVMTASNAETTRSNACQPCKGKRTHVDNIHNTPQREAGAIKGIFVWCKMFCLTLHLGLGTCSLAVVSLSVVMNSCAACSLSRCASCSCWERV